MKGLLAAAGLLFAAQAAYSQGYVGGSVGIARANVDCAGTVNCDNSSNGGKVFGGYRLPFGLGIEGMVYRFGEAKATVVLSPFQFTDVTLRAEGLGVGVSYFATLSQALSLGARLGVAQNKVRTTVSGGGFAGSAEDKSTQPYFGLQLSLQAGDALSIDFSVDSTRFEASGDDYNARLLGVGMTFRF